MFLLADLPPLDVQRELAAMRAQVAAIRARREDGWLDEERARQVKEVVRDVLADSASRTSFLSAEMTAGYTPGEGGGAFFRAADGTASMYLNGAVQTRFVAASAYGPTSTSAPVTSTRWGFETKMVFLAVAGNVIDPSITYVAAFGYTTQTNRFITAPSGIRLVYARIRKDLGQGWAVGAGIINVPWDIESDFIGSSGLTSGDYSIFNYRMGAGKQPGVVAGWSGQWFRAAVGAFNQINSLAARWDSPQNQAFAVAGRAEAKWGVKWDQVARMSGAYGDSPGLVLGLGLCATNGRSTNPQPPATLATPSAQGVTADARVLLRQTVLIAQYAYMRDPVGAPSFGWYHALNLQASTFLSPQLEAFAEACWLDDVPVEWIAQAGVNWYISGNQLKLTVKSVVPFGGGNVNGIRQIAGGLGLAASDNNANVIVQMQVRF